jgi:hypothetical protein
MVSDVLAAEKGNNVYELQRLGYIGVGSEELLKSEVSLAAGKRIPGRNPISTITMQLSTGHGNEMINADIQGLIFHKQMYGPGNDVIRGEISKNAKQIQQDIEEFRRGKISSRLRDKVQRGANIDVENWESLRFSSRSSAVKFRQEAIELQANILRRRTGAYKCSSY